MKDEYLIGFLFIMIIILAGVSIFSTMNMREHIHTVEKENALLQQKVIDYRWQLEQVQYVIECKGEE